MTRGARDVAAIAFAAHGLTSTNPRLDGDMLRHDVTFINALGTRT